jgi:hypothetical protein
MNFSFILVVLFSLSFVSCSSKEESRSAEFFQGTAFNNVELNLGCASNLAIVEELTGDTTLGDSNDSYGNQMRYQPSCRQLRYQSLIYRKYVLEGFNPYAH